ncbi:MAG: TonB-dependent receptor [Steroidobacteraceae bacterium]
MKRCIPALLGTVLAGAATGALAQDPTIEEVLVTAQKREQSAQDVPISLQAISSAQLESNKVDDIYDLQAVAPSLQITAVDPPGQGTAFALRGLGNSVFNMGFDPAVATFVDGVYRSRSGLVASTDFLDLERIEVLKGPQGTLFGKNTTAGVVHMISRKPSFDGTDGIVEVGFEEYSRYRMRGTINMPFSDKLAVRLSGSYADGSGWLDIVGSNQAIHDLNRKSGKLQVLYRPTENLSIHLIGDYAKLDEICCVPLRRVNDPRSASTNGPLAVGGAIVDPPSFDNLLAESNLPPAFHADDAGVTLNVEWNAGPVTITSITAHREYEDKTEKDNDFTGVDILRSNQSLPAVRLTSEELRVSGSSERLDWVLGGYYSEEDIELINEFIWGSQINQLQIFGGFLAPGRAFSHFFEQNIKSQALFGHGTFKLSDRLKLTAGVRWSEDKKHGSMVSDQPPGAILPFASLPLAVVYDYDTRTKDSEPTYTASLQYDFRDDVMGFATYSRGYKSGGISMTRDAAGSLLFFGNPVSGCPAGSVPIPASPFCLGAPQDPTFKPEKADHVEVGIKSDLLNRRLRVNAAAWYTDFKNLQYQILRPADGAFAVINIEGAESQGVELETIWKATDSLSVSASLQYLDAKFANNVPALTPGNDPLGGETLPGASEWSGNLGLDYKHAVGDTDWTLAAGGNLYFRTEYTNVGEPAANLASQFDLTEGGYSQLSLHAGLSNEHWDVTAWCRNCTDKRVIWSNFAIPFDGVLLGHSTRWSHIGEPRMLGVTIGYKF